MIRPCLLRLCLGPGGPRSIHFNHLSISHRLVNSIAVRMKYVAHCIIKRESDYMVAMPKHYTDAGFCCVHNNLWLLITLRKIHFFFAQFPHIFTLSSTSALVLFMLARWLSRNDLISTRQIILNQNNGSPEST